MQKKHFSDLKTWFKRILKNPLAPLFSLLTVFFFSLLLTAASKSDSPRSEKFLKDQAGQAEERPEGIRKRLEQFNRLRLQGVPPGETPAHLLEVARLKLRTMHHFQGGNFILPQNPGNGGSGQLNGTIAQQFWAPAGPQPLFNDPAAAGTKYIFSGRGTAIALDLVHDPTGNTVYYGAASGGLWKSTNALSPSASFTSLSDQSQNLSVGAIALDTSMPTPVIYVGTGEPNFYANPFHGTGILKSTDGGVNWTLVSAATGPSGPVSFFGLAISKILVDPTTNPKILLASAVGENGTNYNTVSPGVFRSKDGGASWVQVKDLANQRVFDLAYDPSSQAYFASVAGLGFYRSVDQGLNWQQLPSPFHGGLAVTSDNFDRASLAEQGGALYALIGNSLGALSQPSNLDTGLVQSTDGGNSWTPIAAPTTSWTQAMNGNQTIASPGPGALVVADYSPYYTSQVNGLNTVWKDVKNPHPDQHALAVVDATHWFAANDGGLFATANAGQDWTEKNDSLNTIQFFSVSPDSGVPGFLAGGAQDHGFPIGNGPLTWTQVVGGDGYYTEADPDFAGEYYGQEWGTNVLFGELFHLGPGLAALVADLDPGSPFAVIPQSNPLTLVGVIQGKLWAGPAHPSSPNAGWNDMGSPAEVTYIAPAPSDFNTLYITCGLTTGVSVVRTTNASSPQPTWTLLPPFNGSGNLYPGAIAVNPMDPKMLYLAMAGFVDGQKLFVYRDDGTGWTNISGNLPNCPMNWIALDPTNPNAVYVASDLGVFYAADGGVQGENWSVVGHGLPNSSVRQVKISETSPRRLVAATYGRGAWTIEIPGNPPPLEAPEIGPNPAPEPLTCTVKGDKWSQVTKAAAFTPRIDFGAVVFNKKMWVLGGRTGKTDQVNDVWSSLDGNVWSKALWNASFSPREDFSAVAFDPGDGFGERLFVIGGAAVSAQTPKYKVFNDVWTSPDGISWTMVNPKLPFTPRTDFAGLVFNGRLWVIGGDTKDDVWSSAEGAEWIKATDHVGSPNQVISHAVVLNGKIFAVSDGDMTAKGGPNHVWSSLDGSNWTPVPVTQAFPPRDSFVCLAFDNKIWVIDGNQKNKSQQITTLSDAWSSLDGAVWNKVTFQSAPDALAAQAGLVFNGQMWMIGGLNLGKQYQNGVWQTQCN